MENRVRIFRENPIAWWDKPVMRHLRKKYGANKRLFVSLRGVYLALCEIESDFVDTPITFFTQTVGTYAGVTREVAGRCIKLLEDEGLVVRTQIKEQKTNRFSTGTVIMLRSLTSVPSTDQAEEPLPRIASSGDRRHRGSWATYKNISEHKKVSMNKNVKEQREEIKTEGEKANYFAQEIARKLGDTKSISFYRQACLWHDPQRLLEKAHEIMADGGARNPGAVFVKWLNGLQRANQSETL
jgi:hypothetical protein